MNTLLKGAVTVTASVIIIIMLAQVLIPVSDDFSHANVTYVRDGTGTVVKGTDQIIFADEGASVTAVAGTTLILGEYIAVYDATGTKWTLALASSPSTALRSVTSATVMIAVIPGHLAFTASTAETFSLPTASAITGIYGITAGTLGTTYRNVNATIGPADKMTLTPGTADVPITLGLDGIRFEDGTNGAEVTAVTDGTMLFGEYVLTFDASLDNWHLSGEGVGTDIGGNVLILGYADGHIWIDGVPYGETLTVTGIRTVTGGMLGDTYETMTLYTYSLSDTETTLLELGILVMIAVLVVAVAKGVVSR
jgi:hypothetical protein